MLDVLEKGGPVLWLLIVIGLGSVWVIIERLFFFHTVDLDEAKLRERLQGTLYAGRWEEALALATQNQSPLASLLRAGILQRNLPEADRKDAVVNAASQEVLRLENNLHLLQTVSHIAPLLGLLGTVTGCMHAFGILGNAGTVSDPSVLARGISEALINTVAGILVAVPNVMFYNHFVRKVQKVSIRLEQQATDLLLMLAGRLS